MQIQQFVMAYRVEPERLKALLPAGYFSLRPVLRINAEILGAGADTRVRIEYNTPVAAAGKRGWLNWMLWESPETQIQVERTAPHLGEPTPGTAGATKGRTTTFSAAFLRIAFTGVGIAGGCPAERDNDGCFFLQSGRAVFVPAETISSRKEYCDCEFAWQAPVHPAAELPMLELLGAYQVTFDRALPLE